MLTRVFAVLFATIVALVPAARAEIANGKVRIGVLTDLSGGYEQNSGNGSVEAAKMAAEEFGSKINGKPIEIFAGDHQNKPDVGASIAKRWFDVDKVDAITDLVNSAVGFAVLDIAKRRTRRCCSPAPARPTLPARRARRTIQSTGSTTPTKSAPPSGSRCRRSARPGSSSPPTTPSAPRCRPASTDASQERRQSRRLGPGPARHHGFLLLRAAGAGLEGGRDRDQQRRRRRHQRDQGHPRIRPRRRQKIVPLGLDSLPAIKSATLEIAGGGMYVKPWMPARQRRDQRVLRQVRRAPQDRAVVVPGRHLFGGARYLKAVEATNSTDPKIVLAKMRETPVKDGFTNDGTLRPDGRMVHDVYVVQIKIAGRIQKRVGFSQARFHDQGRQRVPPAQRGWLPRLYEVIAARSRSQNIAEPAGAARSP